MSNALAFSTPSNTQDAITREFKTLVGLHANQNNITKRQAVELVARDTKLSIGTLENLSRERVKHMRVSVRDAIRTALLQKLHDIINQTRHEVEIAKLVSDRADAPSLTAAETKLAQAIQEAQKILGER